MQRRISAMFAVLVVSGIVAACGPQAQVQGVTSKVEAVVVQKIENSSLKRLALSKEAAGRLDVQTMPVGTSPTGGTGQTVVPYSAIVYDADGATWTYTSPEDLVFVRQEVTVDRIADELAILTAGPTPGTLVVTVGAAELWGVETGVGGGH